MECLLNWNSKKKFYLKTTNDLQMKQQKIYIWS